MVRYKLLTGESRFRVHLIVQGACRGCRRRICRRLLPSSSRHGGKVFPCRSYRRAVHSLSRHGASLVRDCCSHRPPDGMGATWRGEAAFPRWRGAPRPGVHVLVESAGGEIYRGGTGHRPRPFPRQGGAVGPDSAPQPARVWRSSKKRGKVEERLFLSSGASAGLSAAFNAPLAGVIFALEEVHKSFSPLVLMSAMMASLAADFVSKHFFGLRPVFSFGVPSVLP